MMASIFRTVAYWVRRFMGVMGAEARDGISLVMSSPFQGQHEWNLQNSNLSIYQSTLLCKVLFFRLPNDDADLLIKIDICKPKAEKCRSQQKK